jgi:hypothetical protein
VKRDGDILWKSLLEEVFDDLLRFIFPGMEEIFDFKRGFEFLDKELAQMYPEPGKESATRFVDKLVKVFCNDGKEQWLLVHIEVQGQTSTREQFAERMFRYFYRIFDRYRRPVTGIAIYTGRDGDRMPDEFSYACLNTQLVYRYNTLSILDFTDEELEESDNPFAMVVMVAKKALIKGSNLDGRLLEEKLMIVRLMKKKGFSEKKIAVIMAFLHNYVRFEKPGMNRKFEEEVNKINGKNNPMGIIEYLAEKRAEELAVQLAIPLKRTLKRTFKKKMERLERKAEGLGKEAERLEKKAEGLEKRVEKSEKAIEKKVKEGAEEASRTFVENLLKDGHYTQVKIASLANVSLGFVRKVKKGLAIA